MAHLIPGILAHAVGGAVLAWVVWAVGLGTRTRTLGTSRPGGYALGLLTVTAGAVAVLVTPWLGLLVVPALLWLLVRGSAPLARAAAPFGFALPGALGLGFALAWLLHPPTASLDSNAYGDFVFYAAKLDWARESLVPLHDLTVYGENSTYVETAPTMIGAALSHIPGFDPFLFGAATLPAFLVCALALGFGATGSGRRAVAALLVVTCVAYPTWLTESAPLALAVPLAFPLYALWRDGAARRGWIVLTLVVALDFALTKGFGVITLTVVVVGALVRRYGLRTRAALPYVVAAAVAAAVAVAVFLVTSSWLAQLLHAKFLPADAVRGLHRQLTTRDTQGLYPALLVVGEALLLAGLARRRAWTFAAATAAGIVGTWFVGGHGFDVTIGLAVLLAALYLADAPAQIDVVLGAAGVALALSAWFRDVSGVRTALLFLLLLGLGLAAALRRSPRLAAAAAVVAVAAPLALTRGQTTLYREDYEVWRRVHDVVPRDAVVFTSMTGPRILGDEGWNYYPGVADRQLYLAGWSNSSLLVRRDDLARLLELNRRVLAGSLAPSSVARASGGYYAVVRRDERAAGRRIYANARYALYRMRS